jgi:hypothetical protein
MATIAILIGTPNGTRLLAASVEREAAIMAEAVLFKVERDALPVPLWVQCGDAGIADRLTRYLVELQTDLMAAGADGTPS